jgi:hypothetical protein
MIDLQKDATNVRYGCNTIIISTELICCYTHLSDKELNSVLYCATICNLHHSVLYVVALDLQKTSSLRALLILPLDLQLFDSFDRCIIALP